MDVALNLTVTILMLFLPQFLLSLFSTLNFRVKSSLKILYRQPSLIILPTVTFFTFSRLNIGCSSDDSRVSFSKKFTYINITVSSVGYVCLVVWWYFNFLLDDFIFVLVVTLPLHVLSIHLTALFLHLDKLPCCCCNPKEQLSVYDPDLDKRFIMKDGEVVEDPEDDVETVEDDVETGTKTCCGWCRQTEEKQTEHVVVTIVSSEYQQYLPLPVPGDVSEGFSSSENPAKVYDDEHLPLLAQIDEDDTAGVDLPDKLHKAAADALVTSDTEGDNTDTEELVNIVLARPIRQSENEAVDIVTELIDNIITDIL